MRGVYLIHFEEPYKHARHYLGYSDDIGERILTHQTSRAARLMQVINAAGITWRVARIYEQASRTDERRLKGRGKAPICPLCNQRLPRTSHDDDEQETCLISRRKAGKWVNKP